MSVRVRLAHSIRGSDCANEPRHDDEAAFRPPALPSPKWIHFGPVGRGHRRTEVKTGGGRADGLHKLCATSRPRGRAKKIAVKTGEARGRRENMDFGASLSSSSIHDIFYPLALRRMRSKGAFRHGADRRRHGWACSKVMMIAFSTVQLGWGGLAWRKTVRRQLLDPDHFLT